MKSGRLLMLMLGMVLVSRADQLPECSWGRGSGATMVVAEGELGRKRKKEESCLTTATSEAAWKGKVSLLVFSKASHQGLVPNPPSYCHRRWLPVLVAGTGCSWHDW
ncbi:uncharacterized protein B0J16DRAFT_347745 [Fusarium flagelliforme]|uniref:uncharacterized protein n=1 Tax=Fusarium flagelliforme TaxID=2675880 RepID=UPI001E8DFE3F|nr:uncharacterized protein B0J16DRAFT_347745 [Fusarium flagelliforme]KAH7179797.1 hypothetical protein B0J16DRAFT_347745 [Fusarium flagelliforme]